MNNRRTFIKSAAAMMLVPLLKFQPETIDRHKLLSMFLDDTNFGAARWDFTRPYIVGEHSYATDCRVMARITTSEPEHDDESIRVPPMENVWRQWHANQTVFKPFRLAEFKDLEPSKDNWGICPQCLNRRVTFGTNYPDDSTPDELLRDYDPDDNTVRDVSCSLCRGHEYTEHCFQRIYGSLIRYDYAAKLASIPGCEVANGDVSYSYKKIGVPVTLFRSDVGIAGIVMPVIQ